MQANADAAPVFDFKSILRPFGVEVEKITADYRTQKLM